MAIAASISVLDGQGTPVSQTFELVKSLPNGNDRIMNGSTALQPTILQIRHNSYPAKGSKVAWDRRSVTCYTTVIDGEGELQTVSFQGNIVIPRSTAITTLMMDNVGAFVRNAWGTHKADLYLGKS